MLLVSGLPLFFLELSLGQYAGISPLKVFPRLAPLAAGLGWGMLMITFLVVIYYNLIIAWTIYYTVAGFAAVLPWARCGEDDLTSRDCYQRDQEAECLAASPASTFWSKRCSPVSELCQTFGLWVSSRRDSSSSSLMCYNGSHHFPLNEVYTRVLPSEDYFKRTMLGLQEETSWDNLGGLKLDLVGCLAAAWIIVCLCLIKGVQSSGKVVYFTALFPYLVLLILLIRGATLEGAYAMFTPHWRSWRA